MAKAKNVSIEDYLIPEDEQLFELPSNWVWVRFDAIAEDMADGPFGSNLKTEHYTENREVRIIQLSNVSEEGWRDENTKYTTFEHVKTISRSIVEPGNIVIAKMMPAGRAMICPNDEAMYVLSSDNVKVVPRQNLDTKYLVYGINSQIFRNQVLENTQGITRARTSIKKLKSYAFPLAPLAEQKRIVEQIENLFSKLDEAKDKAQFVVESYESRKKSILHNAFEGLYSAEWRKRNKCSIDDWKDTKINEVCIPRAGYAFDSKKFTNDGFQIIRMGNLYAGKLDLSRSPVFYDRDDVDDSILKRSLVHDGDILLTLTGTKYKRDYGYAVCIEGNPELLVNQRILCLTPTEKIEKDYLLYYLRSEIFRDIFFSNETGGVNQGNVSSKFVENIEIKLPSIEEQKEISRILLTVLDNEEQAKDTAEYVIEQIDIIKKSILAKAFRGELGTNNPDDERAIELLRRTIEGVDD